MDALDHVLKIEENTQTILKDYKMKSEPNIYF